MITNAFKDQDLILLTGVTGALGSEILPRLVNAYPQHTIITLIRGSNDTEVNARLLAAMDYGGLSEAQRNQVHALRGNVCAKNLGLNSETWFDLAARTTGIFHLAANVNFDVTLIESRVANVDSTREILDFAKQCMSGNSSSFRLNVVSTAYVAGTRRGLLRESELNCGQTFWNAYEQSKMEAEELILAARDEVPTTIYRPSQIIGESKQGRIRKFFGFYEFLKIAQRGSKVRVLPADPESRADMVPVDYVCDAILYLSGDPDAVGNTYHLAAGIQRSISVEQVVDIVCDELQAHAEIGNKIVRPRVFKSDFLTSLATPTEVRRYNSSALKLLMSTYLPYLAYERDFDVADTHQRLAKAGIEITPIDQVVQITTKYAVKYRDHNPTPVKTREQANESLQVAP